MLLRHRDFGEEDRFFGVDGWRADEDLLVRLEQGVLARSQVLGDGFCRDRLHVAPQDTDLNNRGHGEASADPISVAQEENHILSVISAQN